MSSKIRRDSSESSLNIISTDITIKPSKKVSLKNENKKKSDKRKARNIIHDKTTSSSRELSIIKKNIALKNENIVNNLSYDDEKFAYDFLRESKVLYSYALRLTKNYHDADELLQDTFISAYRGRDGFKMGSNFRAWLSKILYNNFINKVNKKAPLLIEDYSTLSIRDISSDDPSLTTFLESSISEPLKSSFNKLSDDMKEVIFLIDVEGFSYQECSEILGVKIGTVMSRLSRGREKLKEHYILLSSTGNHVH